MNSCGCDHILTKRSGAFFLLKRILFVLFKRAAPLSRDPVSANQRLGKVSSFDASFPAENWSNQKSEKSNLKFKK